MNAIVLAGGASRRMGREKAAIVIEGVTLLERAIRAVRTAGAQRVVVVGLAPTAAIAPDSLANFVRLLPDTTPGLGPLSGLIAGLKFLRGPEASDDDAHDAATNDVCIVVACDHPELDAAELGVIAAHLGHQPSTTLAVLPVLHGRRQPLHAAYRLSAVDPLELAFRQGERSVWRALEALGQTGRSSSAGSAVMLLERGDSTSHRSYLDLDDQSQLQQYLENTASVEGKPGSDDSTSR